MSLILFWQEVGVEYVGDGLVQATGAARTSQTRNYSYKAEGLVQATGSAKVYVPGIVHYKGDGLVQALGAAVTSQTREFAYRADGLAQAFGAAKTWGAAVWRYRGTGLVQAAGAAASAFYPGLVRYQRIYTAGLGGSLASFVDTGNGASYEDEFWLDTAFGGVQPATFHQAAKDPITGYVAVLAYSQGKDDKNQGAIHVYALATRQKINTITSQTLQGNPDPVTNIRREPMAIGFYDGEIHVFFSQEPYFEAYRYDGAPVDYREQIASDVALSPWVPLGSEIVLETQNLLASAMPVLRDEVLASSIKLLDSTDSAVGSEIQILEVSDFAPGYTTEKSAALVVMGDTLFLGLLGTGKDSSGNIEAHHAKIYAINKGNYRVLAARDLVDHEWWETSEDGDLLSFTLDLSAYQEQGQTRLLLARSGAPNAGDGTPAQYNRNIYWEELDASLASRTPIYHMNYYSEFPYPAGALCIEGVYYLGFQREGMSTTSYIEPRPFTIYQVAGGSLISSQVLYYRRTGTAWLATSEYLLDIVKDGFYNYLCADVCLNLDREGVVADFMPVADAASSLLSDLEIPLEIRDGLWGDVPILEDGWLAANVPVGADSGVAADLALLGPVTTAIPVYQLVNWPQEDYGGVFYEFTYAPEANRIFLGPNPDYGIDPGADWGYTYGAVILDGKVYLLGQSAIRVFAFGETTSQEDIPIAEQPAVSGAFCYFSDRLWYVGDGHLVQVWLDTGESITTPFSAILPSEVTDVIGLAASDNYLYLLGRGETWGVYLLQYDHTMILQKQIQLHQQHIPSALTDITLRLTDADDRYVVVSGHIASVGRYWADNQYTDGGISFLGYVVDTDTGEMRLIKGGVPYSAPFSYSGIAVEREGTRRLLAAFYGLQDSPLTVYALLDPARELAFSEAVEAEAQSQGKRLTFEAVAKELFVIEPTLASQVELKVPAVAPGGAAPGVGPTAVPRVQRIEA